MEEEVPSSPHRLSDPLSRLSDVPGSSCSSWSGSNPGSPRLPPRRASHSPPLHRASVDWQERCMELQMEVHRYRHQAANVRDMLKDKLNLVTKQGWRAMDAVKEEPLVTPVDYVLLKYHSKTQHCVVPAQCRKILRQLQQGQVKMLGYDDIEYNFYIAGDGNVYEGRGWTIVPLREHELVGSALYIVYMGDFDTSHDPPPNMRKSYDELVKYGIENNYIKKDFKLYELRLSDTLLRDYKNPRSGNPRR